MCVQPDIRRGKQRGWLNCVHVLSGIRRAEPRESLQCVFAACYKDGWNQEDGSTECEHTPMKKISEVVGGVMHK